MRNLKSKVLMSSAVVLLGGTVLVLGYHTTTAAASPQPPLKSLMLNANDLPSGYAADNSGNTPTNSGCFSSATHSKTSALASFDQGGKQPVVFESLDRKANARARYASVEHTLSSCRSFTSKDGNRPVKWSVKTMSFSASLQTNQLSAYDLTASISGVKVNLGLVYMRVGSYLMTIGVVNVGSVDHGTLATVVGSAVNKLPPAGVVGS
jgi:hypothetical protein